MDIEQFEKDLCILLHRHGMENASNTPDFVLAKYLTACLIAFDNVVLRRAMCEEPGTIQANLEALALTTPTKGEGDA